MKKLEDLRYERSWVEIDLEAITRNLAGIRKRVGDNVKIMAVLKTDGYGHGALPIAEHIKNQVDFFAVASIAEAVELKQAGLSLPVLILGYTSPEDYETMISFGVRPSIYSLEQAERLSETAVRMGKTADIHIALDTGMTRIGFPADEESADTVREISKLPGIRIEGLFTHLSCGDMKDKTHACGQMKEYDDFVSMLEERGVEIAIKHVENSAGIMDFDHHRFQMVRAGIILYGLLPSDEVNLASIPLFPALSWKSRVVHIHEAKPGRGVSYGADYITKGGEKIATISTGYGDGYPRSLSGKGSVLIRGKYAPILGRVCMDQFMVDATEIPGVSLEDEVVLIGKSGEHHISVEDLAALSHRFNYEFVCDINKRVPRYYRT